MPTIKIKITIIGSSQAQWSFIFIKTVNMDKRKYNKVYVKQKIDSRTEYQASSGSIEGSGWYDQIWVRG